MAVRVVAAAIVRGGAVLAARRAAPHRLAGGWEFPGGKVEPGEDDAAALMRECVEELSVTVDVGARLATVPGDGIELVLYAATLASGEPIAGADHDELRWLGAATLGGVAWLPADADLLPAVLPLLT